MQQHTKLSNDQLERPDIESYKRSEKAPVILVLDNVRSAVNVGSIFRTADAFNVQKVYLCGITATPPNKDILKSALGATESVAWEYAPDALELITTFKEQDQNYILSIEQTRSSTPLNEFRPLAGKTHVLVLGNEIDGVSQDIVHLSHACIEIPQFGTKHSLNVAVSAGIVLWETFSRMRSAGLT